MIFKWLQIIVQYSAIKQQNALIWLFYLLSALIEVRKSMTVITCRHIILVTA